MHEPESTPQDVVPFMTDLRTGTEVHPDIVAHHALFLQGEPYYKEPNAPAPQQAAPPQ